MSLKFLHQVIIFAGVGISLLFAWWCFTNPDISGDPGYRVAGGISILVATALVAYEFHFLKKTRKLILS